MTQSYPPEAANYVALSPLNFLQRSAQVFADRVAIVHGDLRQSWSQTHARCVRMASALNGMGVARGDVVAVLAPNIPALYEAHFGVPLAGATLLALNTRLDAPTTAYILNHSGAKVLLCDREFAAIAAAVLPKLEHPIQIIDIDDPLYDGPGQLIGQMEYEQWIATGDAHFECLEPLDEWDTISLNYTSGTTGQPKGALYSHRAAYLNAMGNMVSTGLRLQSTYLWTLPMFHCNGWCFPWTLAMIGATNVCLRRVEPEAVFKAIEAHRVEYFCAAPVVLTMLANAPLAQRIKPDWTVQVMTGGAAPAAALIEAMAELNIEVGHLYGLTETLGPSISCAWHDQWSALDAPEQARLKSRIGVRKNTLEYASALDRQTGKPVPWDGETIGELVLRGNTVMKGYLNDPQASAQAFEGGWFHTGDLVVVHPDGYFEIKDRLKDIVISGGENISTVELEGVLYRHPDVLEAAVVAMPDPKWGESPCAFVTLKSGAQTTAQVLIEFCRQHMASFKVPRRIVFAPLPKTSTGKIQKYLLRQQAKALTDS